MDTLNQFYNDEHTREDVKSFILGELDRYALELVYERGDTKGIADAKEAISRAFIELGDKYGQKKKVEVVNRAR